MGFGKEEKGTESASTTATTTAAGTEGKVMVWMTKKNPLDKLLSAEWNEQASGMWFCKYYMLAYLYQEENKISDLLLPLYFK